MKRIVLPFTTLGVLILTSAVLYGAGWVTPRSHQAHFPNKSPVTVHAERPSAAFVHFQHGDAAPWRGCLLQARE